jgi:hypothetical protein
VSLGEVVEYPDIVKTVEAVDPDGNKVTFVQDLSGEANEWSSNTLSKNSPGRI